jgi:simple sugar transport system permease protein
LGSRLIVAGVVAIVVGLAVKLLFTTDAEIAAHLAPAKFSVRIVWFIAFAAVATWVLGRTRFGSWTFAVGGNKEAARQVGVPAGRTKTHLFMIVSGAAWLVGMLLAFRLNSIQAGTGDGLEFEYIIAAVVGGTLLTGGYGTAIGGAIGAMIMAMSAQGIPSARWNTDWRFVFLGAILLLAVIANRSIRTRAEAARRAESGLPPNHAADAAIAEGSP